MGFGDGGEGHDPRSPRASDAPPFHDEQPEAEEIRLDVQSIEPAGSCPGKPTSDFNHRAWAFICEIPGKSSGTILSSLALVQCSGSLINRGSSPGGHVRE